MRLGFSLCRPLPAAPVVTFLETLTSTLYLGQEFLPASHTARPPVPRRMPATYRALNKFLWDEWLKVHSDPDTTTRLPTPCEKEGEVLVLFWLNNSLQELLSFICPA